jgi:lipopolysaccharide assembly outer membrane protein LptD (OstA)
MLLAFAFLSGIQRVDVYGQVPDSVSTTVSESDTLPQAAPTQRSVRIESRITYEATDSLMMDFRTFKAHLYGNYEQAGMTYQKIVLRGGYLELDFKGNLVYARGFTDTTGQLLNNPEFTEGERVFSAREMYYHLGTRQGFIRRVVTNEGEGYLLGDSIKKLANDHINIASGSYTTCSNHDAPHFEIYFRKAKVIPQDKIVTGPAFLRIEGIPTPLLVPFGFFPNKKGQASGILIPSYGEADNRGFFLENGGYYFGINDHLDLALRGDIYSRGSWALKGESMYKVRYRYQGRISANYAVNKLGDRDSPDYSRSRTFFIRWNHAQEPGSRPNSRFSANVNLGSSDYHSYNPTTTNDFLTNTFSSSINYSAQLGGLFNLSAAMSHSQNTLNKEVQLRVPEVSLSTSRRIYPFRGKAFSGKANWYHDINMSYNLATQNSLTTLDSLLGSARFRDFNNGMQHSIPVQSNINVKGWLNINNTFQYTERWYLRHYDRSWNNGILITPTDTLIGYLETDTVYGFKSARNFSLSSSWSTKMYGFYDFTRGPVTTLRHVLTPTITMSYTPDFAHQRWGYYRNYLRPGGTEGQIVRYSIFETLVYGSPPAGESGRVGFSLGNIIDMKVKSKKDTLTGIRKVVVFEGINISTAYDIARDSLNWDPLLISARTTLFKNLIINFSGAWDPYQVDTANRRINRFEIRESGRLFRRTSSGITMAMTYKLSSKETASAPLESSQGTEQELLDIARYRDSYIDWDNPWSFSFNYSFTYSSLLTKTPGERDREVIQTLGVRGDFNLTPKWKVEGQTNIDLKARQLSFTEIRIWRDLHCWDMSLNWIPAGQLKSYTMTIKVKSAVLQDLKLTRKSDFRDNPF